MAARRSSSRTASTSPSAPSSITPVPPLRELEELAEADAWAYQTESEAGAMEYQLSPYNLANGVNYAFDWLEEHGYEIVVRSAST